jgi:Zn-dependent M28 family amino/carboxypeptidase
MALGAITFGLSALFDWSWMRWLSLILIPVQVFALALCLHAEFTPFTPGANDNASGVGVTMGLAARLIEHPLDHTEVHLVFTDCEESGAYGIQAYLDAHSSELGEEAVYLVLDEVGNGTLKYLTEDGLVFKHKTHPLALELAQDASSACPEIKVYKGAGIAYTDALPATKRGLIALTLCTLPPKGSQSESHWHQMSDTFEHVAPRDLDNTHRFTWQILKLIDAKAGGQPIRLSE